MSLPISGSLQHFAQHGDEGHRGGNFAAVAAGEKFLEEFFVMASVERLGAHAALRHVAAECFATRTQIPDLFAARPAGDRTELQ